MKWLTFLVGVILVFSVACGPENNIKPGELVPCSGERCGSLIFQRTLDVKSFFFGSDPVEPLSTRFVGLAKTDQELAILFRKGAQEDSFEILWIDIDHSRLVNRQLIPGDFCDLEWNGENLFLLSNCQGKAKLLELSNEDLLERLSFEEFESLDSIALSATDPHAWLYSGGKLYYLDDIASKQTAMKNRATPILTPVNDITLGQESLWVANLAWEYPMVNRIEQFDVLSGKTLGIYNVEEVDGLTGKVGVWASALADRVFLLSADGFCAEFIWRN